MAIRATVWNEYVHERQDEHIGKVYPEGIHGCIAKALREAGIDATTATLDQPEHGLTQAVLDQTQVLLWWGHIAHGQVEDAIVDRVQKRVEEGMGLIVLHSGHASKIFQRMMGMDTSRLKWREDDGQEILWVVDPAHPIAEGLEEKLILPKEEMYGEHFNIPQPDQQVFISWFEGGEVFRSGCCWHRGRGRVFYFQPGHEAYPIYHMPQVQRILVNAVKWACPQAQSTSTYGNTAPVVR